MSALNKIRNELLNDNQTSLQDIYVSQLHSCQNYLVNRGLATMEDAKDIYADAILILRKNILSDKLKAGSNIKSYLLGICMNLAKSNYREYISKQSRESEVKSLLYERGIVNHMETEDVLRICKQALEVIEPKGRRILELYYFENYSMAQIAKAMGYSSSDAAKSAKYRVYKKWITEANKRRKKYFESI